MARGARLGNGRRAPNPSPPEKLREIWPFVEWLDKAQYVGSPAPLIAGPVFQRLAPADKVLTHWLVYILDAQTDFRKLWAYGGPVFAELVEAYTAHRDSPLKTLTNFIARPTTRGEVATLVAQHQEGGSEIDAFTLAITPRFPWMYFSVGTTLLTLSRFEGSLVAYLAAHESFLLQGSGIDLGRRAAFLLYLLTYSDVPAHVAHPDSQSFRNAVMRHAQRVARTLSSNCLLEAAYQAWNQSHRRYHKRLWAAFRDYVKRGGEFQRYFAEASAHRAERLSRIFGADSESILVDLEVPGDVWNLRFFTRLLGPGIKPAQLRVWFDDLRQRQQLPADAAVERFDISFRFSPAMCDLRREGCCVFREISDIWQHCPPRKGLEWRGSPCPVTDHLCGIHYACEPRDCPVRQRVAGNLCAGCKIEVR